MQSAQHQFRAYEKLGHDKLAQMKEIYEKSGGERNDRFHGYIGKKPTTA
ncbi:MAG TPA: hypothetical protein VMT29_15200 [Steroidobacteraceae bacterium]|nr:hypothetical protein [Steroidobacteraceae bacterium]